MTHPLEGIRVLDMSRVLAGPFAGRMLADLGADVVKVEPPDGDVTRNWGARIHGQAGYFNQQNVGKRGICVNLDAAGGADLIKQLVARADVLIENFRPDVMGRLGLGYDVLKQINPRLVMLSISGFGHNGPESRRAAYAPIVHAESGLIARQKKVTGAPAADIAVSIADTNAALHGLVGLLSALLILAVSWMATLSRKNAALEILVREKVRAQEDLQQAHDLLEERVRERTAQLKVEMTARREAEVHFKATLAERTRLAQELHDTLEQCLTGIGLQLDTAAKLFGKQPEGASHHLEVARDLMTQSQIELRRSIWDLRSRELEQFDLPKALQASARESFACTNIEVELETTGTIRHLSEVVEENLLRIGREAFTNVIRHAGASRVKIGLEFGAQAVTMRITDNGRGFSPANCPGASGGHFGLLGMSERTKRLEGQLRVVSAPGEGTRLEVEVPLRLANNATAATAAAGPELI